MRSATWLVFIASAVITSAGAQTETATSLVAAPGSANIGQAVTLTAGVSPASATGTVTFYDGTSILGVAVLSNGSASLVSISIAYGKRSLTARYSGSSTYGGSLSPPVAETITNKPGGAFIAGPGTADLGYQVSVTAVADLNQDGNADVVITSDTGHYTSPGTVWVFLGNGDGSLQAPQSYTAGGYGTVVADINMDGIPDLVVNGPTGVSSLVGAGSGTFTIGQTILEATDVVNVQIADFNSDGKPDVVVLRSNPPEIEILFGNGDGTFQTSSPVIVPLESAGYALAVADFNGDGIADLAVANADANYVTILLGTGPGAFGAPTTYTSYGASTLIVGDVNNDGKPDLLVGAIAGSFDLLLGNGDGTFSAARTIPDYEGPPLTLGCYPLAVFDFDGDGNPDVLAEDANSNTFILLGNGDGTFRAPLQFYLFASRGGLVADLNHDGVPDFVTAGLPASVQPWLGALAPVFTLTASPNPPAVGQAVTLNAACNYQDATGTISFTNIEGTGTPLGTAPLVHGSATLNLGSLGVGPYIIHATYSGDTKYAATVLPPLYLVAQQSIGSLAFTASPNPAALGQPITLTAAAPINVGDGAIEFLDGTTPLAQTVFSQTATFTTTLAAGIHQLTAVFPGYLGYLPTSATLVETVQAAPGGILVPGPSYHLDSSITQAVALDLNRDGLPDLAVLDPGNSQVDLLLNDGQGVFASPSAAPLGYVPGAIVATGTNNYYSYTGFAVTNLTSNSVTAYQYIAAIGAVGTTSVGLQPVSIATADFDGDGVADLVTANAAAGNVTLILSSAPHPVSLPAGDYPDAVVSGDFNHDGKADFAVANRNDNNVMVFLGNGDGTFQPPVTTPAGSGPILLAAGDLNGDFKTDLVAVDSGSDQVTVLLSNGDGTFNTSATVSLGSSPSSVALADMNGDNKIDLVVATEAGLLIFAGNGNGTFGAPVTYPQYAGAASLAPAAFASDGRMDLAITLPAASSVALLINGAPTTTSLSVSPSASTLSQKVTLKATISPAGATGFVAFYDGVIPVGGAPVSNSTASFTTALLLPGVHSLSARFTGGAGVAPSVSGTVPLNVTAVPSSGLFGPTTQTFVTDSPINLIPGDFNNDGIEDFAFWRQGNGLRVLLGNGNGTFNLVPPGLAAGGSPAVTADFNNDGNTDIAYINGVLTIAKGNGAGGFQDSTVFGTGASIAVADFNADGRTDIVLANPAGTADVLLGVGDGTFQGIVSYPAGQNPALIATGDFNGDGKPDIIVVNNIPGQFGAPGSGQVNFLSGNGDGTFAASQSFAIPGAPTSMAVADFNGDGHLDLAIGLAATNTAVVLLGNGDGTFAPPLNAALGGTSVQLLAADMNGDGRPDLVGMFNSPSPLFAVLYGNGDGTFAAPVTYSDVQAPSAIAVGDVNQDGSLDVIVAEGDTVNVFTSIQLNVSPTAIFLDATSQASSINVTTNDPSVTWTASAGGGFISLSAGATGTGSGTVGFTVTANNTGADRVGTVTIGPRTASVTQRANAEVFTDVVPADYYFDFADVLYTSNITAGCSLNPLQYCPDSPTSREEMAVFLVAAIERGNSFTYTQTPYFTDVPPGSPYFEFVQKIKDLGITAGCTATTYCPNDSVTREEMAVFIILGRYGAIDFSALSGYSAAQIFSDVPPSSPFFPFIQEMAEAGITAGCGSGMYCPNASLTRGQMAVFIVTGLLNQLLGPTKPLIATAVPNVATPGQAVPLTLSGVNTNFVQGTTQVTMAPGITPSGIVVSSATSLTVQVAVGSGVVPGPTSIVVTTGTEDAVLPNGFTVQ
jgi:hypothetical protein